MSSRAFILLMTCVALTFAVGCAQAPPKGPGGKPPAGPGPKPPAGPDARPFTAEEQKAANFAQAFLKKEGIDWGSAIEVRTAHTEYRIGWKGDGYRIVTYPTPEGEVKRLGNRSVVVEMKSGEAVFVPRD